MNEQDKEAFENWFSEHGYEEINQIKAWQAALEYERRIRSPLSPVSLYEKLERERERSQKLVEALELIRGVTRVGCEGLEVLVNHEVVKALAEYKKEG